MSDLHKLQTYYSYDDVLDMAEVIAVNDYNHAIRLKEMQDSIRR